MASNNKYQSQLFEGKRIQMNESFELTFQSINAYGPLYDHWCIAWSGGKDSTATVTFICWAIKSGKVKAPKSLTVMYADTRLELTPLYFSAQMIILELKEMGIEVRVVMAPAFEPPG